MRTPGRVTLRRLNRVEYNNTLHDLLGTDLKPANTFPVDDAGYGFDNNHDNLPFLLMGKGGGTVKTGRHLRFDNVPITNMWLSMLERAGAPVATLGDSTGKVQLS